jgi:predicted O-linked N-acetylglucosamine transferase (SPINDLY family)
VYCSTPRQDSKSLHLRSRAEAAGCIWRTVGSMPEAQLVSLIRSDLVDVLIELTGVLPALKMKDRGVPLCIMCKAVQKSII